MKFWVLLMLCAVCAAAPSAIENEEAFSIESQDMETMDASSRNILVNALIRQMFAYIRYVIRNGSAIFKTPPLDPLDLEHMHVYIPALLLNLDLNLKGIRSTGIGDFVVHRSHLNLAELTFDIDISVPNIYISAAHYDLVGDLFTAIPLYGEGVARFEVEEFRMRAKLFLKQSEDGKSVIIDRIESPSFEIPKLKSGLTGVIGGGDIDAIVNAITEDVIMGYVNRFQGVISQIFSKAVILVGNPILEQLDTWRFIAPFIPRPRP
ncbi:unnamed protein product [Chilo suppressalis]|uniref:Hemolymph juvenile hormone binding protein n=1 Tax=Chilo suppressalis TaxID=168631 RepID=A0ABN8BBB9_CHISP|nr:unnamed protein product [Chilo suppressalis]